MMINNKDGKRRLFNADYRESLGQTSKAGLIIADPPYNLALEDWDVDFNFEELLAVISEKLDTGGSALIFNILPNVLEMHQLAEKMGLHVQDLLIWIKPNFPVRYLRKKGYVNKNREFILWVSKSKIPHFQLKPDETYHKGVFDYPSPAFTSDSAVFPYQKPRALIDDLIQRHSQPFDLVLDLFAGSGIVAKSCKQWNRRYIGYEIDEKQFNKIVLD
ncbi:Modification methylase DpnIIB [Paraliobacillus sp. PM-2]|uniref:DNA-methyltransferase n=1 Tax=Paraliobacillus sp. PM-2 TaxID=1462524 RepID=UPI00061C1760|nr:site-specific DNA-methyltransferase [Paraliobacillus sp. PM-2]CQR47387.1 Modification methylase DpnIIB [Paraliobacillus sp. PM-2]